MTVNVFLKIDRNVPHTLLCLRFWLETFKNYSTFILCDNPDLSKKLESCFVDYPKSKLINSDRSLVQYLTQLKSSKRNMATANLTGFGQSKDADAFWMIDADTLGYEFTISDSTTWEAPWTVMFPMRRSADPIYEYACHEGNYSMAGILGGWRRLEALGQTGQQ